MLGSNSLPNIGLGFQRVKRLRRIGGLCAMFAQAFEDLGGPIHGDIGRPWLSHSETLELYRRLADDQRERPQPRRFASAPVLEEQPKLQTVPGWHFQD